MLLSRLAASTTVAVLVTSTACAGSSSHSSQAGSTSSSITASASPTRGSSATAPGASPSEGPSFINGGSALADAGNLVTVLEAVNPKIGTNKNDLIAKSKALCAHVNGNESQVQLEADASQGFTNGSWVPSGLEAQAIVGTVKAYGGC